MCSILTSGIIVLDAAPPQCSAYYTDTDLMGLLPEYVTTLELAHELRIKNEGSKHVLARWASGQQSFIWLAWLIDEMLDEQQYRFGLHDEAANRFAKVLETEELEDPRQDEFFKVPRFLQLIPEKIPGNAVKAYRSWYMQTAVPVWTRSNAPPWWDNTEQLTFNF